MAETILTIIFANRLPVFLRIRMSCLLLKGEKKIDNKTRDTRIDEIEKSSLISCWLKEMKENETRIYELEILGLKREGSTIESILSEVSMNKKGEAFSETITLSRKN